MTEDCKCFCSLTDYKRECCGFCKLHIPSCIVKEKILNRRQNIFHRIKVIIFKAFHPNKICIKCKDDIQVSFWLLSCELCWAKKNLEEIRL